MTTFNVKKIEPDRIYINKNKDGSTYEVTYEGIVFEEKGKEFSGVIRYPKVKLDLIKSLPCDIEIKEVLTCSEDNPSLFEIIIPK